MSNTDTGFSQNHNIECKLRKVIKDYEDLEKLIDTDFADQHITAEQYQEQYGVSESLDEAKASAQQLSESTKEFLNQKKFIPKMI